jgi:large subunit ribosomal protein L10
MTRGQKDEFIDSMRQDLERAAGVLFVDFTGMTVTEADSLRQKVRGVANVSYRVAKNTLVTRAMADTPYADAAACLKGTPTGVLLGFEDPVTPAKVIFDFGKECEHAKVKGGIVDRKSMSVEQAKALSALPSREELQGAIVGLAKSPGGRLASQLRHPSGRIVGAIDALHERLGEPEKTEP